MAQRQRKGTPQQSGGGNTMFYAILALIAVAGLLAIGYALVGGNGQAATEMIEMDVTDVRELYEKATPITMGDESAPVKVVEFGDFQCPGCAGFATTVKPSIQNRYVQNGKVQFIYYDFPLGGSHVHSFLAARAARCAGDQELPGATVRNASYWAMHDKIYQEQPNWSYKSNVIDDFVDYAGQIGLNEQQFESCVRSDKYADVVTANRLLGDQLRVMQTPTVLVNNRRVETSGQAVFNAIEQALQRAGSGG